jgi:acyl-CoA synthetase (AMP-forming)/AMP-acid ligase II
MSAALRPPKPVAPSRAAEYVAKGYWDDRQLRDGIEAAVGSRPGEVAVADNRGSLSWAQLAARVQAGVGRLSAAGVRPGHAVLLISGNTNEGLIAYHSLLRAGVLTVLLDRRCGAADIRTAMEAAPVSTVIAAQSEIDRLGSELAMTTVLPFDDFGQDPGAQDAQTTWEEPDRDAVAVVFFTSGTTNRPKGVTHSINTLTRGAQNMATQNCADPSTVMFLVSPLTSITGLMQMHMAADQHSTLVLEDAFEPNASLDRIGQWGATHLGGAPVIPERLLHAADARAGTRLGLRMLALGGAMLPRPLLERAMDGYGIQIVRVYGSSEAPNATGSLPTDSRESRLADDGAPTPGLEVRVGSSEHPQEGMLRGPGLFLGYIDAEDNEAAFDGDWYRTGDLIELANGRVTVVGRLKEVVNRNGLKVSLTEIEAALAGYPAAAEFSTFGLPDRSTGERLAVAVVPKSGAEVTLEGVLGYLRSVGIPARKLPEQLVIWDEPLPRTASGKVIRSRLVIDFGSKRSMLVDRLQS